MEIYSDPTSFDQKWKFMKQILFSFVECCLCQLVSQNSKKTVIKGSTSISHKRRSSVQLIQKKTVSHPPETTTSLHRWNKFAYLVSEQEEQMPQVDAVQFYGRILLWSGHQTRKWHLVKYCSLVSINEMLFMFDISLFILCICWTRFQK